MSSISKVTVIIPSLNPDEKLKKTVQGLINVGFTDIVLINDGSKAECEQNFPSPEEYPCCTVINHWINRGKGAGLKTAFAYVRKTRPESLGVVAVDGDGQHRPEDVFACAMRMLEENKIILGARNFNLPGIPARSVFGNKMTAFVFKFLCGIKITDTQTGLRAIPIEYQDTLMAVKGDRFEYETNMLLAFKDNGIPFAENSIETVYIEENKTSHFNPLRDSYMIYKQIFGYAFSSLSATLSTFHCFPCFLFCFYPNFPKRQRQSLYAQPAVPWRRE
jgi:glycosyltransferase involved in cell wall biosynthesis